MKFRLKSDKSQQIMGKIVNPGDILEGDKYKVLVDIGVLEVVKEDMTITAPPKTEVITVTKSDDVVPAEDEKKKKKGLFGRSKKKKEE